MRLLTLILGNRSPTSQRRTFLTTEPLENIVVRPRGLAHEESTSYAVTGDETRIPWN